MRKIFLFVILFYIIATSNNSSLADPKPDLSRYDCVFLYSKINEDKYFKDLEWVTFNHYNWMRYPIGLDETVTNEVMVKYVRCLDKLYELNKLKDFYSFKLKYYAYRSEFTNNYSEMEALPYWKKYLYVFYKIHEKTGKNDFIPDYGSPLDAIAALNRAYKPAIPKGVTPYDYWRPIITHDKDLVNDRDINGMVFPDEKSDKRGTK